MEFLGFKDCMAYLLGCAPLIKTFITDRHASIRKYKCDPVKTNSIGALHLLEMAMLYMLNLNLSPSQVIDKHDNLDDPLYDRCNHGDIGCLPFSQKIRKFRFEVKWKGNLTENLFGNCGQAPKVVHFFRSERNLRNALTICQNRSVSRLFLMFSRQIE